MKQLHQIQREILLKLLFTDKARYTDLKPDLEIENSHFNFHLDSLIGMKLIEKGEAGYRLTTHGKEFANRIDSETKSLNLQAKLSAWVCPVRTTNGEEEYLIYTRLKNPFYGAQGFMTGKINYGEEVLEAAKREMFEETNLRGDPELILIRHYINKDKENEKVIEDKYFFLVKVVNPSGELLSKEEGHFEWVSKSQFPEKIINHFDSYDAFLEDIRQIDQFDGQIEYQEFIHYPENF